jgi:hypothetical protein
MLVRIQKAIWLEDIGCHSSALDDYPPNAEIGRMGSPYAQKILHFYCYTCKDYELKTSPHYRNQKRRIARRRKKEATQMSQSEQDA